MKYLIILLIALSLFGCDKVAEATGSSTSPATPTPESPETEIDRAYYETSSAIYFSESNSEIEIYAIVHKNGTYPSGYPDRVIVTVPAGTSSSTVNLRLRDVATTINTQSISGTAIEFIVGVVNSENILANPVTMNTVVDVLDKTNAEDYMALYVNGDKICYWYLNKF